MKFVILGLLFVSSAYAGILFCDTGLGAAGVFTTTARCSNTVGTTAVTGACSCGSNNLQVAQGEFCFLKADKTGLKTTAAQAACAADKSTGLAAADQAKCYCGTDAVVVANTKYCDTSQNAKGALLEQPKCNGDKADGSVKATAGAGCTCGLTANGAAGTIATTEQFCFVKQDKTGVITAASTIACAANKANGQEVTATVGCYCGTSGKVSINTASPTKAPTKAPTNATTGGGGATAAITVKQEVKFGIAKTAYTGDVKTLVERSYGLATKICTGNCTAWSTGYSLASAAARRASCTVTFTTTCADKTKSAAAATAAKAITATSMKSQMDTLKTQAGLAGAVPAVSSVAAPKDSAAVVAAASTNGVSIGLAFTALCLAVTALRQ